jgi:hypothetical protein
MGDEKRKTLTVGKVILAVVLACCIFSALSVATGSGARSKSQAVAAPQPPITESCAELARKFDPSSKLSELQKVELWKAYEGREFRWSMVLVNADEAPFGDGLSTQWKCQGSHSLVSDVLVSAGKEWRTSILEMKKGDLYEIHGRLRRSSTLLGLTADILR